MNSPAATRVLFLAGMVLASAAFAGNDINKCIAPDGQVTLTDAACPGDTETVKVSNGAPGIERIAVAPIPPRYTKLMRNTRPSGGLALDVATLKAARANLQLLAPRSQRLAGLP